MCAVHWFHPRCRHVLRLRPCPSLRWRMNDAALHLGDALNGAFGGQGVEGTYARRDARDVLRPQYAGEVLRLQATDAESGTVIALPLRIRNIHHLERPCPGPDPVPNPAGERLRADHDGTPLIQKRRRPRRMARHQRVAPPVKDGKARPAPHPVLREPLRQGWLRPGSPRTTRRPASRVAPFRDGPGASAAETSSGRRCGTTLRAILNAWFRANWIPVPVPALVNMDSLGFRPSSPSFQEGVSGACSLCPSLS